MKIFNHYAVNNFFFAPHFAAKSGPRSVAVSPRPLSLQSKADLLLSDYVRTVLRYKQNHGDYFLVQNEEALPDGTSVQQCLFSYPARPEVLTVTIPDGKIVQQGMVIQYTPITLGSASDKHCFFKDGFATPGIKRSWSPFVVIMAPTTAEKNTNQQTEPQIFILNPRKRGNGSRIKLTLSNYSKSSRGCSMPAKQMLTVLPILLAEMKDKGQLEKFRPSRKKLKGLRPVLPFVDVKALK